MPIIIEGSDAPIDVLSGFAKRGIKVISYDPETSVAVTEKNGKRTSVNIKKMFESKGHKVLSFDSLNNPENAIQESPVSFMDRLKLSFASEKSRPKALTKLNPKFTDAQFTKDGTLVFKENGIYKRVDPSGMDPGDLADMVGYILPTAGQSLGATGGAIGGGLLGAPGGPVGVGAGGFTGGMAGGAGGATVGEGLRQGIGNLIGVGEGLDPNELKQQAMLGAIAAPIGKGMGLAGGFLKNQALPFALSKAFRIPQEIIKFAFDNPEAIDGTMKRIELPGKQIYDLSRLTADQIVQLKKLIGKATDTAARMTESTFKNVDIKKDILTMYKNEVKNVWGGINQMDSAEKGLVRKVLSLLKSGGETPKAPKVVGFQPSSVAQEAPKATPLLESDFLRLHQIKRFLSHSLDKMNEFEATANSQGGIFLKKVLNNIDTTLDNAAKKLGGDYPELNNLYRNLANELKGFGAVSEETKKDFAKKLNTYFTKLYTGKITEPEKAVINPLLENVQMEKRAAKLVQQGISDRAKNEMIKETEAQFGKNQPNWLLASAPGLMSGIGSVARGDIGGVAGSGGLTLLTAALTNPNLMKNVVKSGINVSKGPVMQTTKDILKNPLTLNLLGDLLTKGYQGVSGKEQEMQNFREGRQ